MQPQLLNWLTALVVTAQGHLNSAGTTLPSFPIEPCRDSAEASPAALAASADGQHLFIACATQNRIAVFDIPASRASRSIPVPASPLGLALSKNGARLYVACGAAASVVCVVDVAQGLVRDQWPAGHTAMAPVLSPDERTLYVCNRFDHDVSFLALPAGQELRRVRVRREPVAADVTLDGRFLLVANHLHVGRANVDAAAALISVIDTGTGQVSNEIELPSGSGLLRDIRISPDGMYACVTHVLAKFHYLPRIVHAGWINQNAISLIDLRTQTLLATVVLDEFSRGAANPWAAAWSADGQWLCVSHAGTHELSRIDAPALLEKLRRLPARIHPPRLARHERFALYQRPRHGPARARTEVPNDFDFLAGLRERIGVGGQGPRAMALRGHTAWVANYFSDSLSVIDLDAAKAQGEPIRLSPSRTPAPGRQGEQCFNDATLCQQGWQSCASCHDADARMDAFNWDLLNDGAHNPKNAKSLLLAHRTPPAMWLGVRDRAETAVRAGLRHIMFADASPEVAPALDATSDRWSRSQVRSCCRASSPPRRSGARGSSGVNGRAVPTAIRSRGSPTSRLTMWARPVTMTGHPTVSTLPPSWSCGAPPPTCTMVPPPPCGRS